MLNPGQAAFSYQMVEFVLDVHLGQRQRSKDSRNVPHTDHAEKLAALDNGKVCLIHRLAISWLRPGAACRDAR